MKQKWKLSHDDEIVLYGFNAYCRDQVDALIRQGYHVIAILDQNVKDRKYQGVDILPDVSRLHISKKVCVFIMLQNGMLHWDIAFGIYMQGVERIVFLPMRAQSYCNDMHSQFIEQYNYMMEGNYALMQVPYLSAELFKEKETEQYRVAKNLDNGESIVWLPIYRIRTALREPEKYRDIPIAEFEPYYNLFSHLSGDKCDMSEYIQVYGKVPEKMSDEQACQYVFEKRIGLYQFFENNFYTGNMDYFVAAAPKAEWNERGYLNLCEGQHRCAYLIFKGMRWVPVRVITEAIEKIAVFC